MAAKQNGVPVWAEGRLADNSHLDGNYVAPVLFGSLKRDDYLVRKEVIEPVLSLLIFEDEEDAIMLANSSGHGAVASVWTEDGDRQQRVAKRVLAGRVFVSCYGAGGGIELPLGSVKRVDTGGNMNCRRLKSTVSKRPSQDITTRREQCNSFQIK